VVCRAPGRQVMARRAIDMHLPVHPRKRCVVVRAVECDPWKAISTLHMPGGATVQGATAVVQHGLRYSAERKFAERWHRKCRGDDDWRHARAHDVRKRAFGGYEFEGTIRSRHEAAREPDAFGLVAIQQSVAGTTSEHGRQFPGEIDSIADTGVHALAADRAM